MTTNDDVESDDIWIENLYPVERPGKRRKGKILEDVSSRYGYWIRVFEGGAGLRGEGFRSESKVEDDLSMGLCTLIRVCVGSSLDRTSFENYFRELKD